METEQTNVERPEDATPDVEDPQAIYNRPKDDAERPRPVPAETPEGDQTIVVDTPAPDLETAAQWKEETQPHG